MQQSYKLAGLSALALLAVIAGWRFAPRLARDVAASDATMIRLKAAAEEIIAIAEGHEFAHSKADLRVLVHQVQLLAFFRHVQTSEAICEAWPLAQRVVDFQEAARGSIGQADNPSHEIWAEILHLYR